MNREGVPKVCHIGRTVLALMALATIGCAQNRQGLTMPRLGGRSASASASTPGTAATVAEPGVHVKAPLVDVLVSRFGGKKKANAGVVEIGEPISSHETAPRGVDRVGFNPYDRSLPTDAPLD